MKLLITGGNGMVGKNILEHQKASNYEILAPSSSELNLRDFDSVSNYIKTNQQYE